MWMIREFQRLAAPDSRRETCLRSREMRMCNLIIMTSHQVKIGGDSESPKSAPSCARIVASMDVTQMASAATAPSLSPNWRRFPSRPPQHPRGSPSNAASPSLDLLPIQSPPCRLPVSAPLCRLLFWDQLFTSLCLFHLHLHTNPDTRKPLPPASSGAFKEPSAAT